MCDNNLWGEGCCGSFNLKKNDYMLYMYEIDTYQIILTTSIQILCC